jgi:hypothetical protein
LTTLSWTWSSAGGSHVLAIENPACVVASKILAINPAHAMRRPKHSVKRGKTPVLSTAQTRHLLDSMDLSTVVGRRDRARFA